MRAVRLVAPKSPLVEHEVAEPDPAEGEVRIAIRACGICHSDAHYRAGTGNLALPRTPGHEIAGVISALGPGVTRLSEGDRVALHYLLSCGRCERCVRSGEQFCENGAMIGKEVDGGYAESIVVPAANAIPVPGNVPLAVAAVMMCSTATSYHALRIAGAGPAASILLLGFGGLGYSALALSFALDAARVTVVDVIPEKLTLARELGAEAIDAAAPGFPDALRDAAGTHGFDVALDFVGRPALSTAALRALAPGGSFGVVALAESPFDFNPYRDLLARERRIVGCSDHLRTELPELMTLASSGRIDLSRAISHRVPLEAAAINATLDALDRGTSSVRTVIERDGQNGDPMPG